MMLDTLINRVSCGRLKAPAPSKDEMNQVFKAVLRAPDHMRLMPWQYIVFEGEKALNELGEKYRLACVTENPDIEMEKQERALSLPHRAPMVVVAVAKARGHEKVPHIEEVLSAGAGVQNLILGLNSLGYGAYWRTGPLAFNEHLKPLLGLDQNDTIVGFIYIGTPDMELKAKPIPEVDDFVSWA